MEWISVDDKFKPEEGDNVLLFDELATHGAMYTMTCHSYFLACISGDEFSEAYRGITHWMPLPEPPKDE